MTDPTTPEALAQARDRSRALLAAGVVIVDPDRTWIGPDAHVAPGARIWPDCYLVGATVVAEGADVRPGCWLEDTLVGEGAVVLPHSVCTGARIGPRASVGPMAHLRPGTVLEAEVKVGNFVEVKATTMGQGAKASHLTYLGDATVGPEANVGAGTITCNYDGHGKHRTTIGARAFIGSNTALVAPIEVGAGAIIGAGSTITQSVPADALAVARGEQKTLPGQAPRLHARNRKRAGKA